MKKYLCTLFLLSCILCACGKNKTGSAKPTTVPSETATVTVTNTPTPTMAVPQWTYSLDTSKTYQTIDGFGAGFTWYADEVNKHLNRELIYDALFKDCGLTILRFKNEYGYTNFEANAETNLLYYTAASARAAERGETIKVLYSSWSPQASLKSNDSIVGGGSLKKDEKGNYCYDAFAQWWTDSIKAYEEKGIPVDYVSIQNECDFTADYDGCEFTYKEDDEEKATYSKAFLATYRKFQSTFGEESPLMIAPETMTCSPTYIRAYVQEILDEAPESISVIGHHLYQGGESSDNPDRCKYDTYSSNLGGLSTFGGEYNYRLWQTEFYRGTALDTVNIINNCLVKENANAYIFWGGVWNTNPLDTLETGNMICARRDITLWPNKQGFRLTGAYYAMRHFSEYIRPGYIRTESTLSHLTDEKNIDVRSSSYISPDGNRVVIILINNGKTDQLVTVTPEGFATCAAIIQSNFSTGFTEEMMYQNLGSMPKDGNVSLPASSVTTIVLDK